MERAPIAGLDPMRLSFPQLDRPQPRTDEPIHFWPRSSAGQPQTPQNLSDVRAASPVVAIFPALWARPAALMQFQHPDAPTAASSF